MPGTTTQPSTKLQCMEIWGSNESVQDAIAVSGMNAWVVSRPHADQRRGGDIHYISTCGHGHIARFAVADVSGHGEHVAELSSRLRKFMRKNINKLDQTRFVRSLNEDFFSVAQENKFATAVIASYYAPTKHLIVCNAGHPLPLWYRAQKRIWQPLEHETVESVDKVFNLPLGIIEPTSYQQFAVQLEKDDCVLLYTDWLIESKSPDGKELGLDGLLDVLAGLGGAEPDTLCAKLIAAADTYRGHAPPDDDMTLILLHHNAAAPLKRSATEVVRVFGKVFGLVKV